MEAQQASQLAVILHADVVGSTELVQRDENLAHQRIQAAFRRLSTTIRDYGGITSELRGDALVAEFHRASDAVCAALAFQRDNVAVNESLSDIQPRLRVGIGMGEVVIADDTITGAGVVLAQRLEQLADPDGVCIQGATYETMPRRLPFDYANLHEQQVKGFDEPVRAYTVSLKDGASVPSPQRPEAMPASGVSHLRWAATGFAVLLFVAAVVVGWWQPWAWRENPTRVGRVAYPLPDKPSIAVLPFDNLSGNPEQEYFVDGMTEDLITDLSKISGLFVIARNSTFAYKGKPVDIKQVFGELGVMYVLEGSVRRAGDQVRINAQLIDAASGGHVWAERYDGSLQDVFAVQDEVTRQIVTALQVNLTDEELTKGAQHATHSVEAHDAFLRGWAHFKLETPDDLARSIAHFERAIEFDPTYAQAQASLATVYWDAYVNDWAFDIGMPSFRAEARANEHLEKALENPTPLAHALQSRMLISFGFLGEAVQESEQAVLLDGNDATARASLANALVLVGRHGEGWRAINTAMRLDPHHPPGYLTILGAALFGQERYHDAASVFERTIRRDPDEELPYIYLAASFAHLDRIDDGEQKIEEVNLVRDKRGLGYLSLEAPPVIGAEMSPFRAKVDFQAFGSKANQERVRAGLSRIAALTWPYLITTHLAKGPGNTWWEVDGATEIDVTMAKALHDRGVLFIDVGAAADWRKRHIPDAINLPHTIGSTPRFRQTTLGERVDPMDEFVVYWCPHITDCGLWAAFDAAKAVAWGYKKVYWLGPTGPGLKEWVDAGYPVETAK